MGRPILTADELDALPDEGVYVLASGRLADGSRFERCMLRPLPAVHGGGGPGGHLWEVLVRNGRAAVAPIFVRTAAVDLPATLVFDASNPDAGHALAERAHAAEAEVGRLRKTVEMLREALGRVESAFEEESDEHDATASRPAALTGKLDGDVIVVPRPHVPHGPQGVAMDQADVDYLRQAARKLEEHYRPFGSNVRATVVKLVRDAADAIERLQD